MAVNFEYYKVFYYVVKYQTISRAAQALHLTQPTVSHYIQALENELNVTLFLRSKHGVTMTPEASVMFQNISKAMEHISKAESDLHNYVSLNTGAILISATEISLSSAVLPMVKTFNNLYPYISINIFKNYTTTAIERLKAGLVDLIIVTEPLDNLNSSISSVTLSPFRDILAASPKYHFLANRAHSMQELSNFPFILTSIPSMEAQYIEKLTPFFLNSSPSMVMNISVEDYLNQKELMMQGLGLGVLPNILIEEELKQGTLLELPLEQPISPRNVKLLYRNDIRLSAAAYKFIELLQAHYAC